MSSIAGQPLFDLDAPRGGNVLEVDPAERRREEEARFDDPLRVLRVEADRKGIHPAEFLEQHGLALHHRQARPGDRCCPAPARPSRRSPRRPCCAGSSGRTRRRGPRGSAGTPGRPRACRPSTDRRASRMGTFEFTSILPPRCRRNVRSETETTSTPSSDCTCSTIFWTCSTPRALTVMSRVMTSLRTSTISTAPISPSACPMADVIIPSLPARSGYLSRMVML